VVIRYVKHQRRLQSTPQNKPPIPPIRVPMRAIQLAEEAAGVVGIPPADLTDEEEQHKQQSNINIGAICCIFFIMDLEN
jgi:hypothetical protein